MEKIYNEWLLNLKPDQRKRIYSHFDSPLDLNKKPHFNKIISVISNMQRHEFLPFKKFFKIEVKYRRDENKKPKRTLKKRPIMYASHFDAHLYSFFSYKWSNAYEKFVREKGISSNVIAYRRILDEESNRGKSNIHFAAEVFDHIKTQGTCTVIVADISSFFDHIQHNELKKRLCAILGVSKLPETEFKILRSLTNFRYILSEKGSGFNNFKFRVKKYSLRNKCSLAEAVYSCGINKIRENTFSYGIPQGSPVSGLLSNIYLSSFDSKFVQQYPGVFYRRYSDDIVLVCPPGSEKSCLKYLYENIKKEGLNINLSKVFIATLQSEDDENINCVGITDGQGSPLDRKHIDYLGFEFDNGRVFLRKGTLQRNYRKSRNRIKKYYKRQTRANPRKQHNPEQKKRSGSYVRKAQKIMQNYGAGINSQQKKLKKFLRNTRKNERTKNQINSTVK